MAKEKCDDKSCLEVLKENYKEMREKYDLPNFDDMNREFQIERVAEIETDFLIREIRKFISEKFSNYLRFIDTVLNPVSAPMLIFSVIKTLGSEEKRKLTEIYKKLAKNEIDVLKLDTDFDEEKEADFVKTSYENWQEMKKDFLDVIKVVEKNWDNKFETNGRGYFG